MAVSQKNFFKDHYDWIVAFVGLALLAAVGFLFVSSDNLSEEDAIKSCESELKQNPIAHKGVPAADFTLLDKVQSGMASPSLIQVPSDKGGNFLASECRVYCQNPDRAACHKPIPYKSKVCPFCGFTQPTEEPADALRGGVDADNDGMADAWELKYGFKPTDPADANQDADGDTFTNREEFEAKTNPKDPNSHPDFLDFLTLASDLRTDELPFLFTQATPMRNGHRLTFMAAKRNQDKKPVIGEAVVKVSTTAEIGKEVVFQLMKIRYVKGVAQDDSVKTGWRVTNFKKTEKLVDVTGSDGMKKLKDVSTVELERISDKRLISVQIGVRKPVAVEEQVDLQWSRGDGKKFTVTTGSEFTLANRKYKVKKLAKGSKGCEVTVEDLDKKAEKIIQ